MKIGPVGQKQARAFVNAHHRHNEAPQGSVFQVGLFDGEDLVGVAIAGRPVAQALNDGYTLEVTRTCLAGYVPNGNSRLYGACRRAAKALGYQRLITYTLECETGASLRASGFLETASVPAAPTWGRTGRPRYDETLFGPRKRSADAKTRWEVAL